MLPMLPCILFRPGGCRAPSAVAPNSDIFTHTLHLTLDGPITPLGPGSLHFSQGRTGGVSHSDEPSAITVGQYQHDRAWTHG